MIPLSLAAIAEITGARPHLVTDPAATADTMLSTYSRFVSRPPVE